jgi:hypothetical protein
MVISIAASLEGEMPARMIHCRLVSLFLEPWLNGQWLRCSRRAVALNNKGIAVQNSPPCAACFSVIGSAHAASSFFPEHIFSKALMKLTIRFGAVSARRILRVTATKPTTLTE